MENELIKIVTTIREVMITAKIMKVFWLGVLRLVFSFVRNRSDLQVLYLWISEDFSCENEDIYSLVVFYWYWNECGSSATKLSSLKFVMEQCVPVLWRLQVLELRWWWLRLCCCWGLQAGWIADRVRPVMELSMEFTRVEILEKLL